MVWLDKFSTWEGSLNCQNISKCWKKWKLKYGIVASTFNLLYQPGAVEVDVLVQNQTLSKLMLRCQISAGQTSMLSKCQFELCTQMLCFRVKDGCCEYVDNYIRCRYSPERQSFNFKMWNIYTTKINKMYELYLTYIAVCKGSQYFLQMTKCDLWLFLVHNCENIC